jgi:hypothetical protein
MKHIQHRAWRKVMRFGMIFCILCWVGFASALAEPTGSTSAGSRQVQPDAAAAMIKTAGPEAPRQRYADYQKCSAVRAFFSGMRHLPEDMKKEYRALSSELSRKAEVVADKLGISPDQFDSDAMAYSKKLENMAGEQGAAMLKADFSYCLGRNM